jgi:hypothetical protein
MRKPIYQQVHKQPRKQLKERLSIIFKVDGAVLGCL